MMNSIDKPQTLDVALSGHPLLFWGAVAVAGFFILLILGALLLDHFTKWDLGLSLLMVFVLGTVSVFVSMGMSQEIQDKDRAQIVSAIEDHYGVHVVKRDYDDPHKDRATLLLQDGNGKMKHCTYDVLRSPSDFTRFSNATARIALTCDAGELTSVK